MRRTILMLAVVGALVGALRVVAPGRDPTAARDPGCGTPLPAGGALWSFAADGPIGAMPAVGEEGTVYLGTLEGTLFAVGCDGAERWHYRYVAPTPPFARSQAFEGSPAVDEDGTILIGDDFLVPNYFFALHPDGTPRWIYETALVNSDMNAAPAIDAQGRIFAGSSAGHTGGQDGRMFAFDRGGRLLDGFSHHVDQPMGQGPVVLRDDRVVFVARSGSVYRFDNVTPTRTATRTGTPRPTPTPDLGDSPTSTRTPTPGATRTPTRTPPPAPTRDAGPVETAVATPAALFLPWSEAAGAAARGALEAAVRLGPSQFVEVPARIHVLKDAVPPARAFDLGVGLRVSEPAAVGDVVLFAVYGPGAEGELAAYRLSDPPRRLWAFPVRSGASAPVVGASEVGGSGQEVYFQDGNGDAVAVDAPSAAVRPFERWRTPLAGAKAGFAPAIGDAGLVYFVAGTRVVAIHRADGEVAWERQLGSEALGTDVAMAPDGTLYVAAGSRLYAVATESNGPDPAAAWPLMRHDPRNTARAHR